MKVLTIVSAAIFVLLCPIIRLAVCREQPMGEPKIANWQNANSRLAHEWLVGCFTGTVIENSFFCFLIGILPNTLHSSPKAPNPLCLSAFRGVKSIRALFTYSSPLFTLQFWLIYNSPICLSHLFPFLKVKSGEEWVKR